MNLYLVYHAVTSSKIYVIAKDWNEAVKKSQFYCNAKMVELIQEGIK